MLSKKKYIFCAGYIEDVDAELRNVRTSSSNFKNYYSDALINVLSIWRRMSSSIAITPRASHQDKNLLIRRCCVKIFLQSGQFKFHTRIHNGEKIRVCHLRNKRFFHANAQHKHYTVHIGIDT